MAGEVLNTYIIVEQGDKVLFIDKHAAHERLNFDRMKAEGYQPMVQALLEPVVFTPPAEEGAALLAQLPLLGPIPARPGTPCSTPWPARRPSRAARGTAPPSYSRWPRRSCPARSNTVPTGGQWPLS